MIEPEGRVTALPRELRWVAHRKAASYRVTIYDGSLVPLWIGDTPDARTALNLDDQVQARLQGHRRLVWQVYALDELGATIAHSPAVNVEISAGPTTSR